MSLLLTGLSRLRFGKHASVRSSLLLILSNGFSSSLLQTPPFSIAGADTCGRLVVKNANESDITYLEKKVPLELVYNDFRDYATVTIGASHGWVATLNKDDGVMRLQDDLNPVASDTEPKRIPLPPLVTLPRCQTQIVTNVSMSSPSPEEEDYVVAVKFLGPHLSFCRPAQSNCEWTNIRLLIEYIWI
ncbi:hypothetical protein ISN45_Aa08g017620 [Arabidopsis thaliana x Arabidopsis arenosa]|uniref:KIB1-4 beta-propeller domain-containing protein n=1 Tax=Arabidopsis thaliana x Arabidopsis arenosa TaxID=1240361 RepID=A0A8T1XHV2_9BRAS|nr:hypothetical protein ISN45_Aa08g017620 [Arabidopsis thaliana x Arabidopsis arenosa]